MVKITSNFFLFFTYCTAVPLSRRLAAFPRTTVLGPRLFSFAVYGNQNEIHFEKSSFSTSCLSAGRITGIRYPNLHFPYSFHGTSLVLILRIPQESALARQDVCVLLPPCEGELRSEVYIECRVDP